MKLRYWVSECLKDSTVYTVRAKTKKEVIRQLTEELGFTKNKNGSWGGSDEFPEYGPVMKAELEYDDAFDLMMQCMTEGNGYWEGE